MVHIKRSKDGVSSGRLRRDIPADAGQAPPRLLLTGSEMADFMGPAAKTVMEYWDNLRDGRTGPVWSEIALLDLGTAMRGIQVVDVMEGVQDFVYRFVGTHEVEIRGWDPTWKTVSEGCVSLDPEPVLQKYQYVVETAAPLLTVNTVPTPSGREVADTSVFLPIMGETGSVDKIMVYSEQREWIRDGGTYRLQSIE